MPGNRNEYMRRYRKRRRQEDTEYKAREQQATREWYRRIKAEVVAMREQQQNKEGQP